MNDRKAVAERLGVTPARVSQICAELGIRPKYRLGYAWYSKRDMIRMLARNTKPGPKGKKWPT